MKINCPKCQNKVVEVDRSQTHATLFCLRCHYEFAVAITDERKASIERRKAQREKEQWLTSTDQ